MPGGAGNVKIAVGLFRQAAALPRFQGRWISADCWVNWMQEELGGLLDSSFTAGYMNNAISRSLELGDIDSPDSNSAVFRCRYQRKGQRVTAYYARSKGLKPTYFPKTVEQLMDVMVGRSSFDGAAASADDPARSVAVTRPRRGKRPKRLHYPEVVNPPAPQQNQSPQTIHQQPDNPRIPQELHELIAGNFWEDKSIRNLFATPAGSATEEHIEDQLDVLSCVLNEPEGWRRVVAGQDVRNLCTANDIHQLRMQAHYLNFNCNLFVARSYRCSWVD